VQGRSLGLLLQQDIHILTRADGCGPNEVAQVQLCPLGSDHHATVDLPGVREIDDVCIAAERRHFERNSSLVGLFVSVNGRSHEKADFMGAVRVRHEAIRNGNHAAGPHGNRVSQVALQRQAGGNFEVHLTGWILLIIADAGNSQVIQQSRTSKFASVTDGLSNTLLAGEASDGFKPWGSPENVRDPALGLRAGPESFGGPRPGKTLILMTDGSVKSLTDKTDPAVMKAIATPNGHESFDLDALDGKD